MAVGDIVNTFVPRMFKLLSIIVLLHVSISVVIFRIQSKNNVFQDFLRVNDISLVWALESIATVLSVFNSS